MTNYAKYIDEDKEEKTSINVRIDNELLEKIEPIIKQNEWTMSALIRGLLRKFVEENKTKRTRESD